MPGEIVADGHDYAEVFVDGQIPLGGIGLNDLGGAGGAVNDDIARQFAILWEQIEAQKVLMREVSINAEKARHSSPQFKRLVAFILNLKHLIQDAKDTLQGLEFRPAVTPTEVNGVLVSIMEKLTVPDTLLDAEMEANSFASQMKSEAEPCLLHDETGARSKQLRFARIAAVQEQRFKHKYPIYSSTRGKAGGRFSAFTPRPSFFKGGTAEFSGTPSGSVKTCYNCGKQGHISPHCPAKVPRK